MKKKLMSLLLSCAMLLSLLPVAAFADGTHKVCVGGVALEPGQYVAANGTQAVTTEPAGNTGWAKLEVNEYGYYKLILNGYENGNNVCDDVAGVTAAIYAQGELEVALTEGSINVLTSGNDGIKVEGGDLTITGPGRLEIITDQPQDGSGLYCTSSTTNNGYLTIQGGALVKVADCGYALNGDAGIIIEGQDTQVTAIGYVNGCQDEVGLLSGTLIAQALSPTGSALATAPDLDFTTDLYWWKNAPDGQWSELGYTYSADERYLELTTVAPEAEASQYDLWVNGEAVNASNAADVLGNGQVTYIASSNTLMLRDYINTDVSIPGSAAILSSSEKALNVILTGENMLMDAAYGIFTLGDLNISGTGSLSTSEVMMGLAADGSVNIASGLVIAVAETCGIYAGEGDIVITGGSVIAEGTDDTLGQAMNQVPDVSGILGTYWWDVTGLGEFTISSVQELNLTEMGDWINITTTDPTPAPSEYNLWVGGEAVTAANAANVFGDGTVSYNASTNTLTLDGYINEGFYVPGVAGIFSDGNQTLNINLKGAAAFTGGGYAILAGGDINFTGSGGLLITDATFGIASLEGDVTIKSGDIITEAETYAIYAPKGDIVMTGGTLIANSYGDITPALDQAPDLSGFQKTYWWANSAADDAVFTESSVQEYVHNNTAFVYITGTNPNGDDTILNPFDDVTEADWFYAAVQYVYSQGLMNGVSDTTFAPNSTTTRAMVWTIMARMTGETISGETWADQAKAWAMKNGISDGTNPDGFVTREQLGTMLFRYAQFMGYDTSAKGSLTGFPDGAKVNAWATEGMSWTVGVGLMQGNDLGNLNPQGNATRAEVATMLMRFCENVVK